MSASRAAANAKLVQRHQRRAASSGANASANKFTEKQSHFERRREEEHVRMMQQASGNQSLFDGSSSGRTAADALVSSKRASWRGDGGGVQTGREDAPSPFAMQQQRKRSGQAPIGAGSTVMSTVGGSTFGLPTAHATRSQRRTARFNLADTTHPALGGAEGSSMLGVAVGSASTRTAANAPWEAIENRDGATNADGPDGPGHKRTREEKFHDVMANSKMHRAQQQRERTDREEETKALDKEIDGLLHLLTPRDKIKEEHDAFLRSGTPHVRHLLKQIKKKDGYEARQLRVRADGRFTVTALNGTPVAHAGEEVAVEGTAKTALSRQQKADSARYLAPPSTAAKKPADVAEVLDEAGRKLLAKIRKGQKTREELELSGDDAPPLDEAEEEEEEAALAAPDRVADDDFDQMLNLMTLDPRRARATDRTLDESEEAELAAQQALLEADRSAIPSLGLAENDRHALTRSEWMEQGGDRAFHMDGEEEQDVYGDNVDIPSSYEGDSDTDERARDEQAEGGEDDRNEAAGRTPSASSSVLDRLMAELESIARSNVPSSTTAGDGGEADGAHHTAQEAHRQRRQHLHKIITQLHEYASHHVLQVAELFRLVLIEAERSFLRHKRATLSRSLLLHLYVITKLFPMSDYRHEVTTPLLLFLCSTLLQARMESLHDVHSYLALAGLLFSCMRSGGGRFCAEMIVAPLNVLLLQIPKAVLEPARYQGLRVPIPIVGRCDEALLTATSSNEAGKKASGTTTTRSGESDPAAARASIDLLQHADFESEPLLLAAYQLFSDVVDLYSGLVALPAAVLEPFNFFERLLLAEEGPSGWRWRPSPAVRAAHDAVAAKLKAAAVKVEDHRTPLAMRHFRPRPLRLFEPLLAEQEANAVKTEIRSMKREIREDKKRVMRHLTAEATVQRRARDKEAALEDAQREKRYNQVLGQLQAQQHTMKTVDAMMSKAKSKQKKSISGLPTAPGGGGGDE